MSLIMGPTEYPLAARDPTTAQPAYNFQWSNARSSPNSMGSTNNSPSPLQGQSQSAPGQPLAPSPLVQSNMLPPPSNGSNPGNNENMTPPLVTPPQPSGSPSSAGFELKSPFSDEIRCGSVNQMPGQPIPSCFFDTYRMNVTTKIYNAGEQVRQHCPMAFNTPQGDMLVQRLYPVGLAQLKRSQSIQQQLRMPQLPQPMPPQPAPAPPPAKKKRLTKKEKEEIKRREDEAKMQAMHQQQMMMQQAHPNMMMGQMVPGGQFGMGPGQMPMPMHAMDPSRPSSSGEFKMGDPRRVSPNAIPPHMKGRSPDGFAIPGPVMNKMKPCSDRLIDGNTCCQCCSQPLSPDNRGIKCTAVGQGCGSVYHVSCVGMSMEALSMFAAEPRAEWTCMNCVRQRPLQWTPIY